MTNSLKRKLAFFKDCLEAESRAQVVWNFPTKKSENVVEVAGIAQRLTVDKRDAQKYETTLELYTREKHLQLSAFFIEGRYAVQNFGRARRNRKISCPVFLFACQKDEWTQVSVDTSKGAINPAALEILSSFGLNADESLSGLLSLLVQTEPSDDAIAEIIRDTDEKLSSQSGGELTFKPGAFLSIERKSANARGSLYELDSMLNQLRYSEPVNAILNHSKRKLTPKFVEKPSGRGAWARFFTRLLGFSGRKLPLPEELSEMQSGVLHCAESYPLSAVSGPPGTGKSFTIACLALSQLSQGKSVLVVSQNQHAADVVRRKLIDDMDVEPGLTMLASEKGASAEAKAQLHQMLRRNYLIDKKQTKRLRKKIVKLIDAKHDLEHEYRERLKLIENPIGASVQSGFWNLNHWRKKQEPKTSLFNLFLKLEDLGESIRGRILRLYKLEHQLTARDLVADKTSRKSLQAFAASLTARNEHYQERYYSDVNLAHVLKAVPLWFAALGNLNRFVPFERDMFDLVIIDEATQCNLSVCLPALQRAKKAVIVGDLKQLKHVSFVSYQQQQKLAENHDLSNTDINTDFRNTSVLDYALDACQLSEQSVQLDEHFRSHPQIIEFSNQAFYQGRLKIMTERPTNRQRSIHVLQVQGERLNKGVNKQEALAVLEKLKSIISEQRRLPETDVHELGVLAFFSSQAEHLETLIFDQISLNDLRRHNIRVGTPFSFQGEERDHMLISCSIDEHTSGNSYSYLNRDDVFNVAITRARDYQTLFLSCEPDQVRSNSKLSAYLKFIREYASGFEQSDSEKRDAFQSEISEWLNKRGIEVYPNFLVAGINIDIMAVYHGRALAIDLIGYEGELKRALSLTQFRMLQRAGLDSFLLPYHEWRESPEPLLRALMLRLGVEQSPTNETRALDKYSDAQVSHFAAIAGGASINKLHARFIKHEEMVASEQLFTLVQQHQRFLAALNKHFLPDELTYKRYLNALHDVLKFCVGNLSKAAVTAELSNSMLQQHKTLFGESQFSDEFDDVIAARLSLIDEQRAKLKLLIRENDKALLQIDKTLIKLNSFTADEASVDPTQTLNELTERLDLYRGNTLDASATLTTE